MLEYFLRDAEKEGGDVSRRMVVKNKARDARSNRSFNLLQLI